MSEHPDQAQELWQSQPVEGIKMSVEEIHRRAARFERRTIWRNRRETIAGGLACALFGYFLVGVPNVWFRISYGLFIAGIIWMGIQLHRKASAKTLPSNMGASGALQFFRAELERQRDSISNVWPWYLAPMVPGYIMLSIAWAMAQPAHRLRVAVFDGISIVLFIGIWKLNQHAARCLQRTIDELNAAENTR